MYALRTPRLDTFSFDVDWSANFGPEAVTGWVRTNTHFSLTTFECLASHIDRAELLLCLQAMPLLEVFKFSGGVLGSRRLRIAGTSTEKALIDQQFLTMLAPPIPTPPEAAKMPCPVLREIYFENAYFSSLQLDGFIKGRIYGSTRVLSECSPNELSFPTPSQELSDASDLQRERTRR
jgi:hypothetical protein